MDDTLLALLGSVDTPTVCNAIEVVEGRRGFDKFTRGTMQCSAPQEGAIVGYARTARIAGINPPSEDPETLKSRRLEYYKHMSQGPRPGIAVVEDLDGDAAVGAFWGEINTTVHKGLGLSGAVTNGLMRDLGDLPAGFPVIAGQVGPSHGFVHVKDIGTPVQIFGLAVCDGDLIHADRHGAIVIGEKHREGLEAAIHKLLATERIVLDAAVQEDFDFKKFADAWTEFERART